MGGASTLAAVVLAGVLAVAGVAKLRAPRSTAATFATLGLPVPAALARAVPVGELGLAALLVLAPAAGGAGCLALLAAFSAILVAPLRAGRQVSCGCFGAVGAAPVTRVELVRNGLLGLLAVAALAGPLRPAAPSAPEVVLVGSALVTGLLVLALCRLRRDVGAVWDNRLAGQAVR